MAGLSTAGAVALAAFGLVAGIGVTAIGPGGVIATAGLIVLTRLAPAGVAGTALVTNVATGLVGTWAFRRSGQLRDDGVRTLAGTMAVVAVVGAPVGVVLNGLVSRSAFGPLLAVVVAAAGTLVWLRRRSENPAAPAPASRAGLEIADAERPLSPRSESDGRRLGGLVGFPVAVVSGLFGLGGPLLSVPLLVIIGTPVLGAIAAAQVQSIVIAGAGTIVYLVQGSVHWPLAAILGIPELGGVLVGHRIAHAVPERWLTGALVVVLVALVPWLVLRG